MDSAELTEWIAFARYFQPLPDEWAQTGLLVASVLSPYSKPGQPPKPKDFVPVSKPPQHYSQDVETLMNLKAALGE